MSQNLREIQMFIAVYEERSFTAAAMREGATQSGVSQHVHNLEDRLGVQLFARNKLVQPTPAADAYYRACLDLLKAHALSSRIAEELDGSLSGDVVVGLMPSMTRSVLAPATLRFKAAHPGVGVRVVEAYSGTLTTAVRTGELDFAIVPRAPQSTAGVKSTLFASTPELLVVSVTRGLDDGVPVCLADLEHLKLVVPGPGNTRRHLIDRYCVDHGVTIARRLEFDTLPGTLELVAHSDWCVVLPGISVAEDIGAGRFTVHPLAHPPMVLQMELIEAERRPLSAAATAFLDHLRDVTDEVNHGPVNLVRNAVQGLQAPPAESD